MMMMMMKATDGVGRGTAGVDATSRSPRRRCGREGNRRPRRRRAGRGRATALDGHAQRSTGRSQVARAETIRPPSSSSSSA